MIKLIRKKEKKQLNQIFKLSENDFKDLSEFLFHPRAPRATEDSVKTWNFNFVNFSPTPTKNNTQNHTNTVHKVREKQEEENPFNANKVNS